MVLARRTGRMRETFPVLLGTLVSQTVLNIAALLGLGVIIVSTTDLFHSNTQKLFLFSLAPLLLLVAVVLAPVVVRRQRARPHRPRRQGRARRSAPGPAAACASSASRSAARSPPWPSSAPGACSCSPAGRCCSRWAQPPGRDRRRRRGAVRGQRDRRRPRDPSNIGIFQLAVISVLHTGFGVSSADALAYGIILQAVEIATAVVLGVPALVREGVTWSDMRIRALGAAAGPSRAETTQRTAGCRRPKNRRGGAGGGGRGEARGGRGGEKNPPPAAPSGRGLPRRSASGTRSARARMGLGAREEAARGPFVITDRVALLAVEVACERCDHAASAWRGFAKASTR